MRETAWQEALPMIRGVNDQSVGEIDSGQQVSEELIDRPGNRIGVESDVPIELAPPCGRQKLCQERFNRLDDRISLICRIYWRGKRVKPRWVLGRIRSMHTVFFNINKCRSLSFESIE